MPLEEFRLHIKRFEELEAHYEELYKGFSQKLPAALSELVFKYWAELNQDRKNNEKTVFEIAQKYIREIWEEYNSVYSMNANKFPVKRHTPVKKPTTKEEADKKRIVEMSEIPSEYHKDYTEVFWESYEEELVVEEYEYAVFLKMKEVFVEFYLEDVLEWDSDYLRDFDQGIYLMCANKFNQEIYELFEA